MIRTVKRATLGLPRILTPRSALALFANETLTESQRDESVKEIEKLIIRNTKSITTELKSRLDPRVLQWQREPT